jgi:predicted amidohydrolase YtcJ
MPGFIDPHLHPLLGAIAFQTVWITPEPWSVMGEKTPATLGQEAYRKALKAAFDARKKDAPIWGTVFEGRAYPARRSASGSAGR